VARCGGCWDADKQNAKNKLVTRQIGRYPEFALDVRGYQCLNTVFMVNLKQGDIDPRFILGVLNSRLIRAFWLQHFYDQRRTFPKIKGTYLKLIPVCACDTSERATRPRYDRIVELVDNILALHPQLAAARVPQAKTVIQRHIEDTDRQIDRLVYELYGLSDAEIALVEESLNEQR